MHIWLGRWVMQYCVVAILICSFWPFGDQRPQEQQGNPCDTKNLQLSRDSRPSVPLQSSAYSDTCGGTQSVRDGGKNYDQTVQGKYPI
jgi:hypothetical protein